VDLKPVSHAINGLRTFNVYSDNDLDSVPWYSLVAGDVVNIFYKSTPYTIKFGLRGRGTPQNPIIVNGVTDASGNRPVIDGNNARTAAGCAGIFSTVPEYGEALGLIVIIRGESDDYFTYQPDNIMIQNLRVQGGANGNSFTTLNGTVAPYQSAGGIWFQQGQDFVVDNCEVTDNGFGIFTMAKDQTLNFTVRRIEIKNNRIWGNGVAGSPYEHNLYIQADSPIIDNNYIGLTRTGVDGSSYKDRSARLIFRNNYVVGSSRALDMVQSEDNEYGIPTLPYYGYDYVYNNYIYNEIAGEAIHYGGDNWGEQDGSPVLFNPGVPYREHLFWWNNVIIYNVSIVWRLVIFDLSLDNITCDAWNSTFVSVYPTPEETWLAEAGLLRLNVNNVVNGPFQLSGLEDDRSNPVNYQILNVTAIPDDPFLQTLLGV
jgi:hypothetical protein